MKSKILALFAILVVFGLALAAYAYTKTTVSGDKATMSCCAKSDSCPMKARGHDHQGEHAGKSCPMKHDAKAGDHKCCGDACPLKKEGAPESTAAISSENGESCCDNCDCCTGKHEQAV